MKSRSEPFAFREGVLHLEDLPLHELAEAREGHPAWVLSHSAVERALVALDGVRLVPVAAAGPLEVLGMLAAAGCWAAAWSSHELRLALEVGFPAARVVAAGSVRDDGFLKDALVAGVAVVPVADELDAANVQRIAHWLDREPPASEGAPQLAPADLFDAVGGLLAPVLAPLPALALDATLPAARRAGASPSLHVGEQPVLALVEGPPSTGSVAGLSRWAIAGDEPRAARVHGAPARGDWVVLPHADAAALCAPDPVHADAGWVMVRGGVWRELPPRPMPSAD